MFIQDLNHLEVVDEASNIKGGGVIFADAYAGAYANGNYFASTFTRTYTSAYTGYDWFFGSYTSANSESVSSSAAA
jgi:hypothetical protein